MAADVTDIRERFERTGGPYADATASHAAGNGSIMRLAPVPNGYSGMPCCEEANATFLYWREHPPAHFHAHYAGEEVVIGIEDLSVLEGKLNPRALGLVVEWATLHQEELRAVWAQARAFQPLSKIDPLE